MSNELLSILCSCKEGKLEELASTEPSLGLLIWDGPDQVIFYECTACEQIFKRNVYILRNKNNNKNNDNGIYEYSDFIPYQGGLTPEEIIDNANGIVGYLCVQDEEKIIAQRKT